MSTLSTLTPPPATQHSAAPHHAHHPADCLNCGHPVPDRFCGRCGQDAHHTHRFELADMLHDIPHSIWHVDKGILYTLKTMVLRPGPTIRSYLAGQRVDHFRPLSLLFMITGLYALLCSVLHISALPPRDPNMPQVVWELQKSTTDFFMKYLSWFYVAMVPVWALFARWLLRRGGYNYAECLIIVAFITAIGNFFALLYLPVLYNYSGTAQIGTVSMLFLLPVLGYATWAYGSLLKHTSLSLFGRLWRGFTTYLLGYVTCVTAIVVFSYAMNWSKVKAAYKEQIRLEMQKQGAKAASAAPTH
ncbi:DUF3667 domain-containing protein [Hymenobacter gummosus]|uniref:DUF3667 domain-containing protein n=1 Tax=Hymenobacter gummosus TaxID=1776032 RepID=A0A3S0QGE5_9BACT|nr:DUF3667 domain-containing protein [Hymenobacter gummosus]RTQ47790.1 DUF3667 domain-containing protein [Hymenobacter gummosus]